MNRRHFLAGILAASAAPAIVRANSLMRVVVRDAPLYPFQTFGMSIVGTPAYIEAQDSYSLLTARALRVLGRNLEFFNQPEPAPYLRQFPHSDRLVIRATLPYRIRRDS